MNQIVHIIDIAPAELAALSRSHVGIQGKSCLSAPLMNDKTMVRVSQSLLQKGTPRCRHQRIRRRCVAAFEVINHLFERDPFNSLMFIDIFDESACRLVTRVNRKDICQRSAFTSHA